MTMHHRRMYDGQTRYAINGDELLTSEAFEARMGYATAIDRDGREYTRGLDEVLTRGEGGAATLQFTLHGLHETWRRDPATGAWTKDAGDPVTAPVYADAMAQGPERRQYFAWRADLANGDWREHGSAYLHGPTGTGKTRGADSALRSLAKRGCTVERVKWAAWVQTLRDSYGGRRDEEVEDWRLLRQRTGDVDVLMFDDFAAAGRPTGDIEDALLQLLDHRIEMQQPTICTSNANLAEIEAAGWDSRIVSRLRTFRDVAMGGRDWRAT